METLQERKENPGRTLKKQLDRAGSAHTPVPGAKQSVDKPLAYRLTKRTFDILFSLLAISVFLLPGVILALIIGLQTKANPIYTQDRVTYRGKIFKIAKFRSMVADSDDVEKYLSPKQMMIWRRERKIDQDPRVTRLGKWLRATSLDELPQFINVLLGDMSIVGPRAVTEDELKWFGTDRGLLLSMRAGMTGLWQTGERNGATFVTGERQRIELEYVRKACFLLDLTIIWKTVFVMLNKTGE